MLTAFRKNSCDVLGGKSRCAVNCHRIRRVSAKHHQPHTCRVRVAFLVLVLGEIQGSDQAEMASTKVWGVTLEYSGKREDEL